MDHVRLLCDIVELTPALRRSSSVTEYLSSTAGMVARQVPVSVCGDMAHHPACLRFLLGLGVRTLSIDTVHAPAVARAIEELSAHDYRKLSRSLLACSKATDTAQLLGLV